MCVARLLAILTPSWNIRKLLVSIFMTIVGVYVFSHWQTLWIVLRTLPRDLREFYRLRRATWGLKQAKQAGGTVGDLFRKTVAKRPNKICFYFKNEKWTFLEVQQFANRVGNYFSSLGFTNGDTVGLFMGNCPEYVALWLGLSKIGVVSALINLNVQMQSLKRFFDSMEFKAVIYGEELSAVFQEVISMGCLQKVSVFSYSRNEETIQIKTAVDLSDMLFDCSVNEPKSEKCINYSDDLLYVYTSGTTGPPKVTQVQHSRFIQSNYHCHFLNNLKSDDVIYTPLPLYHSAGGILGVGQALLFGNGVVLRNKFSASQFWSDCVRYRATVIQHIGSMCRYLLSEPERPEEWLHDVRLVLGSGLSKDIWTEFKTRFAIETVAEFYGSTEAICNLVNTDNTIGAVGSIPKSLPIRRNIAIVKVDHISGEILRSPITDLGLECAAGEPGELVGKLSEKHSIRDSLSTTDCRGHRIARNVISKGDTVLRTGDIVVMDTLGYVYFKDRLVDTFHFRGHTIFPADIESCISKVCDLVDCVVYGVTIPGSPERAVMATILDPDGELAVVDLPERLLQRLCEHELPVFIRAAHFIEQTGTFKLKKTDLAEDGCNLEKIQDDLYILIRGKYERLNEGCYKNIASGNITF